MQYPKLTDGAYPRLESTKQIISAYGRTVNMETFREPDGTTEDWLLFHSDKTPVIIFALCGYQVVVTEQYRHASYGPIIELPGGLIEKGESPQDTVRRELREEARYCAASEPINMGQSIYFDPCCFSERFIPMYVDKCVKASDMPKSNDPCDKYTRTIMYDIDEWYTDLARGEINDSKTIAVSILALRFLPGVRKADALKGLSS